jgi:hypothetical protein
MNYKKLTNMKYAIKVLSEEHGGRVIDALVRKGGKNAHFFCGTAIGLFYYKDKDGVINNSIDLKLNDLTEITLEEFEKTLEPKNEKELIGWKLKETVTEGIAELFWITKKHIKDVIKLDTNFVRTNLENGLLEMLCEPVYKEEKKLPESWDEYEIKKNRLGVMPNDKRFAALRKLELLRKEYVGDWVADWNDNSLKRCIGKFYRGYTVKTLQNYYYFLSFPTQELAQKFLSHFKDLIEEASPFI